MYNSPGIWIVLISITVGIGSELYFFQSLFINGPLMKGRSAINFTNYYLSNKID